MFFVSGLRQNPCIPNQPMYYIMRKWICQGKLFNIGAQAPHRIYPPSWRKVAFAAGQRRREIVEFFSHFLQAGGRETVVGGDDSAPRYSSLWEGRLPHSVREMSRSDRGRPPPSAGGTRKARDGGAKSQQNSRAIRESPLQLERQTPILTNYKANNRFVPHRAGAPVVKN